MCPVEGLTDYHFSIVNASLGMHGCPLDCTLRRKASKSPWRTSGEDFVKDAQSETPICLLTCVRNGPNGAGNPGLRAMTNIPVSLFLLCKLDFQLGQMRPRTG